MALNGPLWHNFEIVCRLSELCYGEDQEAWQSALFSVASSASSPVLSLPPKQQVKSER